MIIYLKHPVHGTKVAIAEQEAALDEEHGWVRYTLEEPDPPPIFNELEVKRRRRKEAE